MKADAVMVEGVELRAGDRVRWSNFGGIVWTGEGTIAGLDVERRGVGVELRFVGVTFTRTAALDARRAEVRAALAPPVRSAPIASAMARGSRPNDAPVTPGHSFYDLPRAEPGYPFGDAAAPVVFLGDTVYRAVRADLLYVISPSGGYHNTGDTARPCPVDGSRVAARAICAGCALGRG